MEKSLKWKFILIVVILVITCFYLAPSVFTMPSWWTSTFPSEKVSLGLDLQGGMHLLLEVETEKALSNTIDRMIGELKDVLLKERIPFDRIERVQNDTLLIEILNPEEYKDKFTKLLEEQFPILEKQSVDEKEKVVTYTLGLSLKEKQYLQTFAVDKGLETIRNRVDEFGVAEPIIQKQSEDRILIQLPGIKDPKRAIDIISRTALLEFKIVNDENDLNKALKGEMPFDSEILYSKLEDKKTGEMTKTPYLLKKSTLLTGEHLTTAGVRFDQFNRPYVTLAFDSIGGKIFERITGENIKKRLAIILDNNVYSAPVIKDRIGGGGAIIEGNFTSETARDLAIVLRAGSLPAPVRILEQRTVGPSLGQDSIREGLTSTLVGGIAVVAFMAVYYLLSGVLANAALLLNILIILAALAAFRATLSLPGIAGIVLTIGMAVDANVLILERIREEIRAGKTPRAAIDAGYSRAMSAIIDSNLTTIISALFLFQFGTGPIKGFAVTLTIGLTASLFTAIVCTRVVYDYVLSKWRVKKLSI